MKQQKKGVRRIEDDRFKHIATDPRFRGVPRSQRKVKIDNRFAAMFDDKRFKLKYVMDKRGRPIHSTTSEDLKKYYAVESSSESENEDDDADRDDGGPPRRQCRIGIEAYDESDASSDEPEEPERDPARGIGNVETSSEEDESSEEELEDDDGEVAWGRAGPRRPKVGRRQPPAGAVQPRLGQAARPGPFVLLDSFKPPGGVVQRVSIYPSEFGKERMAVEQESGPAELVEAARGDKKASKKGGGDDEEVDSKTRREALRQYQLNRLRYYYAIAECDSAETADHLYRELDGREYE
ncbi:hypothetical protein MTO96_002179 [Rhipicephalus appendiculatus]